MDRYCGFYGKKVNQRRCEERGYHGRLRGNGCRLTKEGRGSYEPIVNGEDRVVRFSIRKKVRKRNYVANVGTLITYKKEREVSPFHHRI